MRVFLAKIILNSLITTINTVGKKYLNYEQGLKARKWIEKKVLARMRKWAAKSEKITLDDGLVAFMCGTLKSHAIEEGVKHYE